MRLKIFKQFNIIRGRNYKNPKDVFVKLVKKLNPKPFTLNPNSGQMLVEAMIAITIAIVGLLGIFSLLSNSLSLNRVVGDQVIATNLASEGVELVKNLIDSNIIQRKPWNLGVDPGEFEIDFSGNSLSPYQNRYLNFNPETGEYSYGSGQPAKFIRKVVIGQPSPDEIKTNSIVKWETRGGGKFEINLEDHFFNWR
ncbi:MAG: hypothetical protein AAB674_02760 [Patescibacteria group bacterium]